MSDYVDKFIIRYVCGMRSSVDLDKMVMYPNKLDHTDVRAYRSDFYDPQAKKISYLYVRDKRPEVRVVNKMPSVVSLISKEFADNPRSQNYNMAYQARRWRKPVAGVLSDGTHCVCRLRVSEEVPSLKELFALIEKWDEVSGKKYGAWRESNCDRKFFSSYLEEVAGMCQALFFYLDDDRGGSRLVGYSVLEIPDGVERDAGYLVSRYGPRKVDITAGSNLCQFVDYEALRRLRERVGEDFILHWGWAMRRVQEYEKRNFPFLRVDEYLKYVVNPVKVQAKKLF